jgi:hypothetical protein
MLAICRRFGKADNGAVDATGVLHRRNKVLGLRHCGLKTCLRSSTRRLGQVGKFRPAQILRALGGRSL